MSRDEFMKRLQELLSDIPQSEIEEALNYYDDYFEDAGEENEQEVISSLGSPEKVAKIIKEGLKDGKGEYGEFSENGFHSYEEEKNEVGNHRKPGFFEKIRNFGTGGIVLLVILAIFAFPVIFPLCIGMIAVVLALIAAVIGLLFAVFLSGVVLVIGGIAFFVTALLSVSAVPAVSAVLTGMSFVIVGIGILFAILGGWIILKTFPPLIRWFVKFCQKLLERRKKDE